MKSSFCWSKIRVIIPYSRKWHELLQMVRFVSRSVLPYLSGKSAIDRRLARRIRILTWVVSGKNRSGQVLQTTTGPASKPTRPDCTLGKDRKTNLSKLKLGTPSAGSKVCAQCCQLSGVPQKSTRLFHRSYHNLKSIIFEIWNVLITNANELNYLWTEIKLLMNWVHS